MKIIKTLSFTIFYLLSFTLFFPQLDNNQTEKSLVTKHKIRQKPDTILTKQRLCNAIKTIQTVSKCRTEPIHKKSPHALHSLQKKRSRKIKKDLI